MANFVQRLLEEFRRRPPKSWSVSSYIGHRTCPAQYALNRIIKLCPSCGEGSMVGWPNPKCNRCGQSAPGNRAMDRGTDVHAKGEFFLKGKVRGVPDEFKHFSKELLNLKAKKASPEAQWTITKDWEPCEPTDWDRAWLRAKIDVHLYWPDEKLLTQIDYKTGQIYPQESQAEVYAMLAPVYYPDVETVESEFWYTDKNHVEPYGPYNRKQMEKLKKKWTDRANRMLADEEFEPKPGTHCTRCKFRSSTMLGKRPGPCSAWKNA